MPSPACNEATSIRTDMQVLRQNQGAEGQSDGAVTNLLQGNVPSGKLS